MFTPLNSCSILYTLFAWFLGVCYGFVLISSAAGQNGDLRLFENGESLKYQLHSTLLMDEKDGGIESKKVGFYIAGDVVIKTVWSANNRKLLIVELKSPQLNIKSRKGPSSDGFTPHSSKLDQISNKPFLVVWNSGAVEKIFLPKEESYSLANVKKGIASLLQFQLAEGRKTETDTSGLCNVTYTLSPSTILKTKAECSNKDIRTKKSFDEILKTQVDSFRQTVYEFDSSNSYLNTIKSKETHKMYLLAKHELGSQVEAQQIMTFINSEKTDSIQESTLEKAVNFFSKSEGVSYKEESLIQKQEFLTDDDTFAKEVESVRDFLKAKYLGSLKPVRVFLKLIKIGRITSKVDILKVLSSKKNKIILPQLYDTLGYIQTKDSHEAATKQIHFDDENQKDLNERYLWALSLSPNPNPEIIKDLLKKYKQVSNIPNTVKETLILTLASMVQKLTLDTKQAKEIEETILNNLDYAKDEEKYVFFRALKNLKSKSTIPTLLRYINEGTQKEGVLSWKALKSLEPHFWNKQVLKVAEKSLFQLNRKYDSSSRTLAADILIESKPNNELLSDLVNFVSSNDTAYEIKQYVNQRLKMLADEDEAFKERVLNIIRSSPKINNYSGLSPRGLSISLKRSFMKSDSSNGSLVSVQEMKSGIAKRGTVNVVIDRNGVNKEVFSLGIFSGGLNSFISSDSENSEEEESATAGMELTIMGTQIRPFVFFNGQGELMGHVWSGTASDMTSAFQALTLIQDHVEYLPLGSGFMAQLNLNLAISFDLSGKIEISIWNRNAESLVEKSAGLMIVGSINVDAAFVKSQVEFSASIEPKLKLQTNIDFSSNMHLCMRLSQPDSIFRHNIYKIERIPGSKHKLRIAKYKKSVVPGTTYSINRKNNEMCSAIFS